jgi:hypothetical protein
MALGRLRSPRRLGRVPHRALSAAACAPVFFMLLGVLGACAGGSESTPGANSAEESSSDSDEEGATEEDSSSASPEAEAKLPVCSDEGCLPCGKSLCPAGFYCDETAPQGPACSWLPECPEAECACLKRTLPSSCSCEATGPGATVKCQ